MSMASAWAENEFEAIFREHFERLLRAVRRVLRSDAEAEEVCAEVFLRLYRMGPQAIAMGSAAGWLYRTGTRAAIDVLRRGRRRHEEELAEDSGETMAADDDPLDRVLRAERIAGVRLALASMKVERAQMLLLRHSGFSYREIAAAMKLGVSSVGKTLARAEAQFVRAYRRQQRIGRKTPRLEAAKEER